ncbi:hypothetical protein QT383_04390 [Stenotrophomonas rhizophila]
MLDGFSLLIGLGWALFGLLWIFVPFAIFGIKGLLREILAEQKRTNEILSRAHGVSPRWRCRKVCRSGPSAIREDSAIAHQGRRCGLTRLPFPQVRGCRPDPAFYRMA